MNEDKSHESELLQSVEAWEAIHETIQKCIGSFLFVTNEEMRDLSTEVLIEFWKLATSSERYWVAKKIALENGYRVAWIRSRISDHFRKLRRQNQLDAKFGRQIIGHHLRTEEAIRSGVQAELAMDALRRLAREEGPDFVIAAEVLIQSALTGESQGKLAKAAGISDSKMSKLKSKLLSNLRQVKDNIS